MAQEKTKETTERAEKETLEEEKEILGKEHLKFALSTPSHSGSYHRPDGGDFLKPLVTKSSLSIENVNSKNIKASFHLQPLRELLAKGYVDNDVIEDLQSLEHKLEKEKKRKKETNPQKKHESNF